MPKISVIVPVYNTEKYLPQCLDSICGQTLSDIEIICVNDGSTDECCNILDDYSLHDKRIKVIHQPNRGYGAAMNAGLDMAAGEYIGIVESDDCIQPEMYEALYQAAVDNSLDLVKSDVFYWIESVGYIRRVHYRWLEDYYGRVLHDIDRNTFFDFYMNIWTGIYKREFLEEFNIRFHESPGASYQDNGFWLQTLIYCRSAMWLNQAFYMYRQDNPEASVRSRRKMMAMTLEYEYLEHTLQKKGCIGLLSYCYYYKLFRDRGTFLRIADENKREFCRQIEKDYAEHKGIMKANSFLDSWFREVIAKPDEVCERVIQKKKEIRRRLENASDIIIFGAGVRGDIVFRALYNEGYYDKICCFSVSRNPQDEPIGGKRVMTIQEAHVKYPNALVIIAVIRDSGMYQQMTAKLREFAISNCMDGSDIEENIYIV